MPPAWAMWDKRAACPYRINIDTQTPTPQSPRMFKRFWWVFLIMVVIGPVIGCMLAAAITYVMPKKYESEATIEVRPRTPIMSPLGGPMNESSGSTQMTPQFFGTEFEKIKSRNSLEKVVDNLDLVSRWSVNKETAIRILKGIVNTQNIRGTDLISIRVRHTNQQDAKDVTEEVAKAYKDYRSESEGRDGERVLAELNKAVHDQEDKLEERRKVLAAIARAKGITPKGTDRSNEDDGAKDEMVKRDSDPDYVDAKRDFETDQQLLQQMKIKQMGETISCKMPRESVVIHDPPVLGDFPVSPNVALNLTLGTVLGLLVSPLLALPLAWLLNRRDSSSGGGVATFQSP